MCIRDRGRGRAQSAPESGGGFPAAFAQLGRLPKCPGGWRGVPSPPGAARRSAPARGQGSGAKCPGIWRGVPRQRLPSWAVSQSAREAGGGFPCPAGAPPAPAATRRSQPFVGVARRPTGVPSAPHPTRTPPPTQRRRDRLQKGEGYIPLPHHVTPRPGQLKAAQSNKDYCGLT